MAEPLTLTVDELEEDERHAWDAVVASEHEKSLAAANVLGRGEKLTEEALTDQVEYGRELEGVKVLTFDPWELLGNPGGWVKGPRGGWVRYQDFPQWPARPGKNIIPCTRLRQGRAPRLVVHRPRRRARAPARGDPDEPGEPSRQLRAA